MVVHVKRVPSSLFAACLLAGCTVGPKYHQPDVAISTPAFKENQGWKPATPAVVTSDQPWWSMYQDPTLDQLERQVELSNQNLKAAEAQYRAARAAVGIDRGQLLPAVDLGASAQRSNRSGGSTTVTTSSTGTGSTTSGTVSSGGTSYSLTASASWDIDVWGRIRRTVESDVETAQATAGDLAAAKLSAQSMLADDYFQLRAAEAQERLLTEAVKDFTATLQITKNRLAAGTDTAADVAQAQTQVDSAQQQLVGETLTRATLEHAIALLIGKVPADLAITQSETITSTVPVVPAGVSSTLLERRPDIAAAERRAAAANAKIGVAVAAWYPDITLTGSYGFGASSLGSLFTASSALWSVGASALENVFNGGTREAQIGQARANYDVAVAQYRQTALTAFQQVEDELASLRILENEATVAATTVSDARRSEQLTINQYKTGVVDYTSVVTAQTTRLNAEIAALSVLSQRLTASSDLVNALGGGWSEDQLPKPGFFYNLPKNAEAQTSPAKQ